MGAISVTVAAVACLAMVLLRPTEAGLGLLPRTLQRRASPVAGDSPLPPALGTADCSGQQFSCANCKSKLRCAKVDGSFKPAEVIDCSSDAPYCSAGRCVTKPEDTCVVPQVSSGGVERTIEDATGEGYREDYFIEDPSIPESDYDVPSTLKIGAASAAYQIEGAWNYSDKGLSEQDVFYHNQSNQANGDDAAKSYFKYKEDIELLKELKLNHYRFSLSWARLLPYGNSSHSKTALKHYNDVIDALLAAGIEPVVTIYHWDKPAVFQNDGGWLNSSMQERYVAYARFCFDNFGDRVKTWLLVNEPMMHCWLGYDGSSMYGSTAPGVEMPGVGGYLCNHNMVLAHAKAYRVYQKDFKHQGGKLGSSLNMEFSQPKTGSKADRDAAERYAIWQYAWFADPLYTGDYSPVMREIVDALSAAEGRPQSRLPHFTNEEKVILRGAYDFFALNNYGSIVVEGLPAGTKPPEQPHLMTDSLTVTSLSPHWVKAARDGFSVTPWGLAGCVRWIRNRYNSPPIWITENGYAGSEEDGTADQGRIGYYSGNMRGLMRAINKEKINVIGYTAWSLMDSMEWMAGYSSKFGLVYVDFEKEDRPRTIKDSGRFLRKIVETRHVPYVPVS